MGNLLKDEEVGVVERVRDPSHFDKLFLALMVRRAEQRGSPTDLEENYPDKVHAINTALDRIDSYIRTGNTAHIVDACNFLWIEFMLPSHEAAHFRPITQPGKRIRHDQWKLDELHENGSS